MRPGTDTLAKKLPIVLSSASAYSDAVSKLTTLQQYPLSDLKELARLLGLRPRLAKFEAIQVQQAQQVEGLRRRSASIIYQWQKGHVLGSNQDWVSTEERLMAVEQAVKRKESARAREESDV